MAREIKFRIWDGSQMNYHVLVGKLGVYYASIDPKDTASVINTKYPASIIPMQFTGSVDLNDKEIYEGDIVKLGSGFTPQFRPIIYSEYGSWRIGECGIGYGQLKANGKVHCEVVGNIYQNPELLKPESCTP